MMPIVTPRVPAPPALVALFAPQPMPKHQLLGHAQRLVRVAAPAAAARPGQVEWVAVALAADRCLMVDPVHGAGRCGGQRGVDPLVVGVEEDDVVREGGGGGEGAGEAEGWG